MSTSPARIRQIAVRPIFIKRLLGLSILLLAFVRGGMYASYLPPWGLVDEEQHVHYIQQLAEQGIVPIAGKTPLSPEIIDSLFATRRWEGFHWPTPTSHDPRALGLEGYSYEGYQPPVYYLALAPVYTFLPHDILTVVFDLRWITVILSLLTIWMAYRITVELVPDQHLLPYLVCLLLVVIPERTASVSRVNNDALLEVIATALIWVCTRILLKGPSIRSSQLMGLLLGLGVLTKMSMAVLVVLPVCVFWLTRRCPHWFARVLWAGGFAAALIAPLVIRNAWLYGDVTGFAGYKSVSTLAVPVALNSQSLISGLWDLFRHFWVVWWKGATASTNPVINVFLVILGAISGMSLVGLGLYFRERHQRGQEEQRRYVMAMYLLAIGTCAMAILISYFDGSVPVIQGRFFLPVIVPIVVVFSWGLWRVAYGKIALLGTIVILLVLDTLALLGNLVPYFYYWSAFVKNGVSQPYTPLSVREAWALFYQRFLSDKPSGIQSILGGLIVFYAGALVLVTAAFSYHGGYLSRLWQKIREIKIKVALRQVSHDPLFWATCVLLIVYLGVVSLRPVGVFWSLDEGGKYIYLQNMLRGNDPSLALEYPGRYLDGQLRFVPLLYWARQGNNPYSWWPAGFPALTLPFYQALGWMGLYVLPAMAGALCALATGLIVRRLRPGNQWIAVGGLIITGLATPVAFYSTTFWEHTLSVAAILGAVLAVLRAWDAQHVRWIIVAGGLASFAVVMRTEAVALVLGIELILLILRWRWAVALGVSSVVMSAPWLLFNLTTLGHPLSRQWLPGAFTLNSPLFAGVQDAGLWLLPHTLFNAPKIAAFPLTPLELTAALVVTAIAIVAPFLGRFKALGFAAYIGLIGITGGILLHPSGYRSVHGFVLIAPHIVFAVWLYRSSKGRRSMFAMLSLAMLAVFGVAYVIRGLSAAGGLQWGPRYLLALYPLLVAASLVGLSCALTVLGRFLRTGLVVVYVVCVLIGVGYEARGIYAAAETMEYYRQTEQAVSQLDSRPIITHCTWLPMVIPSLYWKGSVFAVNDSPASLEDWVTEARRVGAYTAYSLEMDLCSLTFLDEIARQRTQNPGGIVVLPIELGSTP